MFEYKIDNITIYNTAAFESDSEKRADKKIASWIIQYYENDIIKDIIDKNYEGFGKDEYKEIIEKAQNLLKKSASVRMNYIEKRLKEYFKEEKNINVLGFIRFRLKEYRIFLEQAVDDAVEQYVCEAEYYEFISLLKEYISVQENRMPRLHIVTTGAKAKYFDYEFKDITEALSREYAFETDLSEDDKLLTTAVLCAPIEIVWHHFGNLKNEELQETLKAIFGENLVECRGCDFCKGC